MPSSSPSTTPPPSAPRAVSVQRRGVRIALWAAGSVLGLLLVGLVVLAQWDWNGARPWINEKVSEATGRHFAIQGDLSTDWSWPQPLVPGWQRWIPGLTVHARDVVLGNRADFGALGALDSPDQRTAPPAFALAKGSAEKPPAQAVADDGAGAAALPMATVQQLSASLRLLPLLKRTVSLRTVVFTAPDVALARLADGRNNWTFTPRHARPDTPNPWNVTLEQLQVHDAELAYADGLKKLALRVRADTLDTPEPAQSTPAPADSAAKEAGSAPAQRQGVYGVKFELRGRYGQADIEGQGKAGSLLTLRSPGIDYPVQLSARAGDTQVKAEGTLANPTALAGMDLQVGLQGASMADLYELTGLVLPSTPPYSTHGHLVGSLEPERARWDYREFDGKLGQSDLHGSLTYTSGQPRPSLKGKMHSNQLRLADLGPVLGTPAGAPAKNVRPPRPGKVLPAQHFSTSRWNAMDLDVEFEGRKIIGSDNLPINNLAVHAVLDNARLKLEPLRFGVAQGKIDAQVTLDSRQQPMQAQVRATVEGLKLSALFPKVELMEKSLGRMDGALALRGQGDSVASMLGSSSGESRLYVRDGTLSKQLLELAALNVGSVVVGKLFGEDREVQLRCAVADFSVKEGVAQTRSVKLSTDAAVVEAVGTIDMKHEHVDLRITPESLEWKFLSLRTPLYVRGPFANPKVGLEPGPLLLRAGAAVAAAAVAPAALALLPITVPAADDDARCARLLAQANAAVKAGPAGAAARPEPRSSGNRESAKAAARPDEGRAAAQAPAPVPAQQAAPAAPAKTPPASKLTDNPLYQTN